MNRNHNEYPAGALITVICMLIGLMGFVTRNDDKPQQVKPKAETCVSPDRGWSANIERVEGDSDWACVMRKGTVTKSFFYGGKL